ncbi:MAG: single-stranded-DNA-specific exonuclease [Clostridia bacterium]|nr:single-stranded-DNA-specific exonuclease [Clostridia bacterium]
MTERLNLARELNISPITAQVLINRGIKTAAAARAFLSPDSAKLIQPEEFAGLKEALERLIKAVETQEKVLIYGDYDVDGLTATAIMIEIFSRLGVKTEFYLPNRLTEGYGLNKAGLNIAKEKGCSLVVTVDCGITSIEEAIYAKQKGLDLIITDHHRPGEALPEATAIINPLLGSSLPPLCGAGVAFKLAQALASLYGLSSKNGIEADWLLDLVALATIADSVPLLGENRLLVQLGLPILTSGNRPGIKALAEIAGLKSEEWDVKDISFTIIPRLNAAGRLGEASTALELLITDSPQQALELAQHLQKENTTRKLLQDNIISEAEAMASAAIAQGNRGLVLAAQGWHPGVIGIVATRLMEKYNCPVIVIALEGDAGRGSGRSIPEVNLHEVLTRCKDHLLGFGGHAQAAGLEISASEIPHFQVAFNKAIEEVLGKEPIPQKLMPEAEVLFSQLDWPLFRELEQLTPFGEGNPRPLLISRRVYIKKATQVGKDHNHLKLSLEGQGRELVGIGFNQHLPPGLTVNKPVDVVFYLDKNIYNGNEELQLLLTDIRPSSNEIEISNMHGEQLVAATGETELAYTWSRQLQEKLLGKNSPCNFILATSTAVRQLYYGIKRNFKEAISLTPLGPWVGASREKRILSKKTGLISCSPFYLEQEGEGSPYVYSPLVTIDKNSKKDEGELLQTVNNTHMWQSFTEMMPLLTELASQGKRILLYEADGFKARQIASLLREKLPGVSITVDTYVDYLHFLLVRESALSGHLQVMIARRELPPWFFPADVVIFNYLPGSQEEVELALPLTDRLPEVYIKHENKKKSEQDLRRKIAAFYRELCQKVNVNGGLYIFNKKSYHQRCYLAILEELGLVKVLKRDKGLFVHPVKVTSKQNLYDSRRYRQLLTEEQLARDLWQQLKGGR